MWHSDSYKKTFVFFSLPGKSLMKEFFKITRN